MRKHIRNYLADVPPYWIVTLLLTVVGSITFIAGEVMVNRGIIPHPKDGQELISVLPWPLKITLIGFFVGIAMYIIGMAKITIEEGMENLKKLK